MNVVKLKVYVSHGFLHASSQAGSVLSVEWKCVLLQEQKEIGDTCETVLRTLLATCQKQSVTFLSAFTTTEIRRRILCYLLLISMLNVIESPSSPVM